MFVLAALLIALFFAKRTSWPRVFVLFWSLEIVGGLLDQILVGRIPSASQSLLASVRDIAPLVVTAAIWIPYVFFSKRVKATFRY
jgi:hypothetical protein